MVKQATKSFGDVMPKIEFYPDLPKLNLSEQLDVELEITEAKIVEDFTGKFGSSDFALMLVNTPGEKDKSTLLCGGEVVVKKVRYALDNDMLPLLGMITQEKAYYDIE